MALLFMDGFDKYGPANSNSTSVAALMAGEWTTITTANIGAPLSATGQALQCAANSSGATKTLSASYGRIIGGVRFNSSLGGVSGIQFLDAGTAQCSISIASTGTISIRNSTFSSGTILGSAASPVAANTTHYLEWDISLGNSANYSVYLDGVSIISGTGDTTATANNTMNGIQLAMGTLVTTIWDDLYLFDTTGTTNNAVLLTSPRIETTLPTSDSAVQFAIGSSVLGGTVNRTGINRTLGTNDFYVRPFTPSRACTLNSLTVVAGASGGTINLRPIVYSDSAGSPSSLLTTGSTVTGLTSGSQTTMPLTTPQSLSAGTQYWLGYMCDANLTNGLQLADSANQGRNGASTFASGAPSSPPTLTATTTALLWGNITLTTPVNFYEVNQQPPAGVNSYVYDSTVNHEDLYNFPTLSVVPLNVYAVAVKAYCARSDSGARTVSLRIKSGSTDSGGSLTGQVPATSYGWIGSNFERDPNGSIVWTGAALNAALAGFKIDA
jgi:hypothetical protein